MDGDILGIQRRQDCIRGSRDRMSESVLHKVPSPDLLFVPKAPPDPAHSIPGHACSYPWILHTYDCKNEAHKHQDVVIWGELRQRPQKAAPGWRFGLQDDVWNNPDRKFIYEIPGHEGRYSIGMFTVLARRAIAATDADGSTSVPPDGETASRPSSPSPAALD